MTLPHRMYGAAIVATPIVYLQQATCKHASKPSLNFSPMLPMFTEDARTRDASPNTQACTRQKLVQVPSVFFPTHKNSYKYAMLCETEILSVLSDQAAYRLLRIVFGSVTKADVDNGLA
ncbi:hypothetical protein GQ600_25499 [Phytophthora cactorum]|nr:hypothetical protein GQ600_25499 [Phytophthora cactorum]